MAHQRDLLTFTKSGIYCPQADVYIDPKKKVKRAIITHAHLDHARPGNGHYLCHARTTPLLRFRLGQKIKVQSLNWQQNVVINGVKISFFPAGHILGSAQVRVEYKGEVWVVSGDYKLEDDGLVTPFEPVPCHTFITESTFALPEYEWQAQTKIYKAINQWWNDNQKQGITSILTAYSLGKAQRLLTALDFSQGKVYVHGTIDKTNRVIREAICPLPQTHQLGRSTKEGELRESIVLMPPGAIWGRRMYQLKPFAVGIVSGWMTNGKLPDHADHGFALSDHADWPGLIKAVKDTGAERIITMHGATHEFAAWLNEQGYNAQPAPHL